MTYQMPNTGRAITSRDYEALVDAGRSYITMLASGMHGTDRVQRTVARVALDISIQGNDRECLATQVIAAMRDFIQYGPTDDDADSLYHKADCMFDTANALRRIAERMDMLADLADAATIDLDDRAIHADE